MLSLENTINKCLITFTTKTKIDLDKEIKDYVDKDVFRKFLRTLSNDNNIRNYSNQPPFFFGYIISLATN